MCVSEGEEDGWKAFDRVCLNRELLWRITDPLIRTREEIERRKMGERESEDRQMSTCLSDPLDLCDQCLVSIPCFEMPQFWESCGFDEFCKYGVSLMCAYTLTFT